MAQSSVTSHTLYISKCIAENWNKEEKTGIKRISSQTVVPYLVYRVCLFWFVEPPKKTIIHVPYTSTMTVNSTGHGHHVCICYHHRLFSVETQQTLCSWARRNIAATDGNEFGCTHNQSVDLERRVKIKRNRRSNNSIPSMRKSGSNPDIG